MTGVLNPPMIPSPHHYRGRDDHEVDLLVVHYTAGIGDAQSTARLFADPKRKASAHYVVGRDGEVVQCVKLTDAAWHAGDGGKSRFPARFQLDGADFVPLDDVGWAAKVVNCRSIGIEICNRGWAKKGPNKYIAARHRNPASTSRLWESYSQPQLDALRALVEKLCAEVPTLRWVTGHEDVTNARTIGKPGAKLDPGPAFPWRMLPSTLTRVLFDFERNGWRKDP